MKRVIFAVASIATASAMLLPERAEAINRYGIVCVKNATDRSIGYEVKIGDQQFWSTQIAGPGSARWFSHQYDRPDENRSDKLYVRFDSDLRSGSGQRFKVTYHLKRRAAVGQSCAEGNQYVFEYDGGNRNYITLIQR